MKVYIVFGETGEYSDYWQWPIRVFSTESAAQKCVDALEMWAKHNKVSRSDYPNYADRGKIAATCPFAPERCDVGYIGIGFGIDEVEAEL